MNPKTIELAGISASIAGGCCPCLDYHFKKAIELGCNLDQVKEAIELGKMIKQRPINDIYAQAEKLLKSRIMRILSKQTGVTFLMTFAFLLISCNHESKVNFRESDHKARGNEL